VLHSCGERRNKVKKAACAPSSSANTTSKEYSCELFYSLLLFHYILGNSKYEFNTMLDATYT